MTIVGVDTIGCVRSCFETRAAMKRLLPMIGLCAAFSGCTISDNFTRTLVLEPLQYCDYFDVHRAHSRHCHMAKKVWKTFQKKKSIGHFSDDYACGFREGFTDFLDAGGTGQPPPLPPRRYWRDRYANPQGRQAVQEWFAGFRHGAAMARASSAREYAMVPLSTPVASVNGMYVNRQTGPTPVTILTPPMPDATLVPPRAPDGGFDISQLPDSTRPFGLLPGALPTHNLPPSTLPPGTSPPGVEPVLPDEVFSTPATPGARVLEAVPPGTMMPEAVPPGTMIPEPANDRGSPRPDDLLPEPSSRRLLRTDHRRTDLVPAQKGNPTGASRQQASATRGASPPYASSRRWASGDRRQ